MRSFKAISDKRRAPAATGRLRQIIARLVRKRPFGVDHLNERMLRDVGLNRDEFGAKGPRRMNLISSDS